MAATPSDKQLPILHICRLTTYLRCLLYSYSTSYTGPSDIRSADVEMGMCMAVILGKFRTGCFKRIHFQDHTPGSSLLANASQVFVIFLSMLMGKERIPVRRRVRI